MSEYKELRDRILDLMRATNYQSMSGIDIPQLYDDGDALDAGRMTEAEWHAKYGWPE